MNQLPRIARYYVKTVIAVGLALFVVCLPKATFDQPLLFIALLLLSSMSASLKVYLPLTTSGSTLSVSYAVDFASLLLLGANETMIVAAASAWSQCTFRIKERNPIYRTLFSMACLIVTVQAAGAVYLWLGGSVPWTVSSQSVARPLVGAATAYFVFVALDDDGRPRAVPPIAIETEIERRRQRAAKLRRAARMQHKEALREERESSPA